MFPMFAKIICENSSWLSISEILAIDSVLNNFINSSWIQLFICMYISLASSKTLGNPSYLWRENKTDLQISKPIRIFLSTVKITCFQTKKIFHLMKYFISPITQNMKQNTTLPGKLSANYQKPFLADRLPIATTFL